MIINGACYIRVSTDEQTEFSPDAQLKAIRDYAKRNNISLKNEHIYIDEGISGKRADKRPAFQNMIAAAKSKPVPFEIILVHKFDRFARSREDSVVYKSLLKKEAGVRVVSVTEHIEDDKFSVIHEAKIETIAEYYSLNLADEVKKGMREKAERGEFQSIAPFGYRMENKKLVVVKEEADIVRFIFEKFASREMGMRTLAIYINDLGIKSRRGNTFENRSVDYILNNPVYLGEARWTPSGKAGRNFNHPDSIIKKSSHEPIITYELWNKAQNVIKMNKEIFPSKSKSTSKKVTWLHGLVHCGACGKTLVRSSDIYMQCNAYSRGKCKTSNSVKYTILEELVLNELKKTYVSPINLHISFDKQDSSHSKEYELIEKQIEIFNTKFERIKIAYQDGIDSLEEYKNNKRYLEEERKRLYAKLAELKDYCPDTKVNYPKEICFKNISNLLCDETIALEIKHYAAGYIINNVIFNKKAKLLEIEYKY